MYFSCGNFLHKFLCKFVLVIEIPTVDFSIQKKFLANEFLVVVYDGWILDRAAEESLIKYLLFWA